MENWLAASPWPGVAAWIILYISDYNLTLYSARGFREVGHFQFEGSFELTPQFQKDINSLNRVSRLHLTLLFVYSLVIYLLWLATVKWLNSPWAYELYLGMFLLLEVAVHMRHLRNVFLVREIRRNGGVEGEITYHKQFSYRISAFDFKLFGGLFLIVAILGSSLFFLGGAIMCIGFGFRHDSLAKKAENGSGRLTESK